MPVEPGDPLTAIAGLTEAGRRLLCSIDTPPTLEGAIPAARRVRACVMQAARLHPDIVSGEWVVEANLLHDELRRASDDGATTLGALSEQADASATYKAFAAASNTTLTAVHAANIDAAIGLMVLMETSLGQALPASVVAAWQTLHLAGRPRQGRHESWKALVDDFPMDLEAAKVKEASAAIGVKAFLAAYTRALAAKIPSPTALFAPGSRSEVGAEDSRVQRGGEVTSDQPAAGTNAEADDDDAVPPSLIGWLRERSARAGYLARFGVEGRWDLQTKAETTAICRAIHQALSPGHPSRPFAVLAVVSICSAMPARRATKITLKRNSDLWLDVALGALRWYLVRLLDGDRAAATPSDAVDETHVVDIWLPAAMVAAAQEFARAHPGAADVFELIFGPASAAERQATLTAYRAWLHSIGHRSLHGVEDARLSRSLGQFYREQSGDLLAALLGLDFDEVALGMLHYISLPRSFLREQSDIAYRRIGLGVAVPLGLPDATVGAQIALTGEQFSSAMTMAFASVNAALASMHAATTAADLISAWTELAEWRLLLTIELTAGRGDRLERLTWSAVLGHDGLLLHADKDIDEYTKTRLVPVCAALRSVLDAHARDLRQFCAKATRLGLEVTSPRGRRFDERAPHRICFYGGEAVEHSGKLHLCRVGIKRSALDARCRSVFDRPLNVGRHTLITQCLLHGVEPVLIKTLSGHVNGHAEPYSDGQWISPMQGLKLLAAALEWILSPLLPTVKSEASGSLTLDEWKFRPPDLLGGSVASDGRADGPANLHDDATGTAPVESSVVNSRWLSAQGRRILATPFDAVSIAALRLIDHARDLLMVGQGPGDRDANLLLNLLLVGWMSLADVKRMLTDGSFMAIGKKTSAAVWQRDGCRAEIRRPLVGPANLALHQLVAADRRGGWLAACRHVRDWLNHHFAAVSWPLGAAQAVDALEALHQRWLRLNVPPFLLTAASTRIAAPTATRGSILRLIAEVDPAADPNEQLIFPAPQPRGSGRMRLGQDALSMAIRKVADYCNVEHDDAEGENWQRAKKLARDLSNINTTDHMPATTFVEWAAEECRRWDRTEGDRIKVSSLNTYTGHLKPAFAAISRDEDLRHWYEEWFSFVTYLRETVPPGSREQMQAHRDSRETAARRLMKTLASLGYTIPPELREAGTGSGNEGMRRSAASVWILGSDQRRVTGLMARHFDALPLERALAPLYSDLRFRISLRSMEAAVPDCDAIDEFDNYVVSTDGFAHLKSQHARRLSPVPTGLVRRFRSAAAVAAGTAPNARWVFLLDDRHDWSLIHDLENAFSAALKQVCRESDARPHASRSAAPLEHLVPGWENMLRRFMLGEASTAECAAFCESLSRKGFGHVIGTMLRTGHGHPVTYLRYYFSIWDVLLSVFAQASLASHPAPRSLGATCAESTAAAYRKAQSRASTTGISLDGWQWMTTYRPSPQRLTAMSTELLPPVRPEGPPKARSAPEVSDALRARYVALRITGQDDVAAAHALHLSTAAAAALETILQGRDLSAARERHQAGDSKRGKAAEIKYLRDEAGAWLAEHLAGAPPTLVAALEEALQTGRRPGYRLPDIETRRQDLRRHVSCLPDALGILIQFQQGQLSSADVACLHNEKARIFVGDPDRDLGLRPRVSVISVACPRNFVERARRTSNARCVIAALGLVRSFKGSVIT